ncbi:MAG TPA: glycine oxidase ThiO [Polyangiaceae bacterium]|nr:glycine oxidase ThiO [Polyangiaceae bacterium]
MSGSVIVVGGGIMGCACAWELARHGQSVVLFERSVPGAEASSAAAGILGASVEHGKQGPLARLARESRRLYPDFVRKLVRQTGIDPEFRECGVLEVDFRRRAALGRSGKRPRSAPRVLDGRALRRLEPALSERLVSGVLHAGDARVNPRLLLRALRIAASRDGVVFRTGAYVRRVVVEGERAVGIALDDGEVVRARHVVVAAGSWTTLVEGTGLPAGAVIPARGQIVEIETPEPLLSRVVFGRRAYLVPRDDGRVLVGSTLEFVGYRREVTAGAVRDLLDAALRLVPALASAEFRASWSSFRPYTKSERPLIGASDVPGLVLATGHYRNGILLAPATAAIVGAVVRGVRSPVPLSAFRLESR